MSLPLIFNQVMGSSVETQKYADNEGGAGTLAGAGIGLGAGVGIGSAYSTINPVLQPSAAIEKEKKTVPTVKFAQMLEEIRIRNAGW